MTARAHSTTLGIAATVLLAICFLVAAAVVGAAIVGVMS